MTYKYKMLVLNKALPFLTEIKNCAYHLQQRTIIKLRNKN